MSCVLANRVVLNCRKISRSVTCAVTGMKFSTTGRTVIVDDDDKYHDNDDDIDGVTNNNNDDDVGVGGGGGNKEVFSNSEEDSGEGVSGRRISALGLLPTIARDYA